MGQDFSALVSYEPLQSMGDERILRVEDLHLNAVERVAFVWDSCGYAPINSSDAGWHSRAGFQLLCERPVVPTVEVSLWTPQGFSLTFGPDGMAIYHRLRWHTFLTDPIWQRTMIDACKEIGQLLRATAGVLTRDQSPVMMAFFSGASFRDALLSGRGIDGEVLRLEDLIEFQDDGTTWDSHGYWTFIRNDKSSGQIKF